MKHKSKGKETGNYRKLLTNIVADEIFHHLMDNHLLPQKQKGCHRKSRGTKDQLLIDKAVMKNYRGRKVILSMVWIDYQKTYDIVSDPWIRKSLVICRVAENIYHILIKSMENWPKKKKKTFCSKYPEMNLW